MFDDFYAFIIIYLTVIKTPCFVESLGFVYFYWCSFGLFSL